MSTAAAGTVDPAAPLLSVRDLTVVFPGGEDGDVAAVRGVSYDLAPGEVLGIVGESGSGKSVSSLAVMGLLPRNARITGSVRLHGEELLGRSDSELARVRGNKIAMVFQDPLSALTPVYTVGDQIAETIRIHQKLAAGPAAARAVELLDSVGIPNAAQRAKAFPHEFSGGMRQRVMIAMSIANDPDVLIADEPTTALDVTIQAQVLDLIRNLSREFNSSVIFITHNLGIIASIAARVVVMYAGRVMETGSVSDIFYRPTYPYSHALLASIPRLDQPRGQPLTPIPGRPPDLVNPAPGCPFAPRCPHVLPVCRAQMPPLEAVATPGHQAACWNPVKETAA
jgi:peptide/nickel transport system ATP-binding protein